MTKVSRLAFAFIAIAALVVFSVMASHPARAGDRDQSSVVAVVQMDQHATVAEASPTIQPEVIASQIPAESRVSYASVIGAVTTERRGLSPTVDWRSRHESRTNAQTQAAEDTSGERPTEAVLRT